MKILLVDDDVDILDVTAYALRREGFHVVTATTADLALARWEEAQPNVVVLDVGLPRSSGLEVCRAIRASGHTPVIFLTARGDEEDVMRGFRVGADDYIVKPFSPRLLAARIRAVGRRQEQPVSQATGVVEVGSLMLERESHEVLVGHRHVQLTPIEFRLLDALVSNAGRVVSVTRLVDHVWGYDEGDASLLKTHISHIRKKLGLGPDGVAEIRSVPRVGYRLVVSQKAAPRAD
jgi:DNA-binding response OmpR family regulator